VTVVHGFPSTRPVQPPRVVVGVDGSETATAALREAIAQAGRLGAELDVVVAYSVADLWTDMYSPVLPLQETREAVRREIEQLVGRITAEQTPGGGPVPHVRVRQIEGLARQTLLDAAEGAAALVVGSRSRGAVRGMLLGSVALHCVVHAPCPVTVVHPEDRPAPVARSAEPATAGR
jgi:nucleotide-binding universal stress UspA family protein